MSDSSKILSARGRVASLTRSRKPEDPDLVSARRDLKAARAETLVARLVAEAPPLSEEQTDRVVAILRGGQK